MSTTFLLKKIDIVIQTCKCDLLINTSPFQCWLVREEAWATKQSTAFTCVLLSEESRKSSTLIHVFLQIILINIRHIWTNTGLQMTGIMRTAVCLHHFWSGTYKISSAWFLLYRMYLISSAFSSYVIIAKWIKHSPCSAIWWRLNQTSFSPVDQQET